MAIVLVNPSQRATAPATRIHRNPPAPRKAASTAGASMKRHRSAAQRAATRRMIAGLHRNPRRKRILHRNPSPVHHYRRRRNPSPVHHFRRRRNPESGSGNMFKELMGKEVLMQAAVIAAMPTLAELAVSTLYPTGTSYTRVAVKAGIGLGAAFALYKFVNRRVGLTAACVALGTAAAEGYAAYNASSLPAPTTPATTSGYITNRRPANMAGYLPFQQSEPGMVRLR